jgi:uncharacterized protein DUF4396
MTKESRVARVPWPVAAQATLHCLTGCAIGEVLGMVIGTAAGLPSLLNAQPGSAILAADAAAGAQWGFLLLEDAWAIVSLLGLAAARERRHGLGRRLRWR